MTFFDPTDDLHVTNETKLTCARLKRGGELCSTKLILFLTLVCFGITNSTAFGQAPRATSMSLNVPVVNATSLTKAIGWKQIADMPKNLGRFELATDGTAIYQLGGVGFNIRSGDSYGSELAVFDPGRESWLSLAKAPFGTGGASLAYWPAKHSLVAIAGIQTLGEQFDMDGMTVGVYDIANDIWTMRKFTCAGLGRPSWLIHSADGRFLVLTSSHGLDSAEKFAELDLNKSKIKIVSDCPVPGRMVAVAKYHDTIFIVQSATAGRTPKRPRLHQFDIWADQHVSIVELQQEFTHVDSLFVWKDHLMMWKNSSEYDRNQYRLPTKLLEINCGTGECVTKHTNLPSPQSRRSSGGVLCGNAFYVFGGQREDSDWLKDSYRFDFE